MRQPESLRLAVRVCARWHLAAGGGDPVMLLAEPTASCSCRAATGSLSACVRRWRCQRSSRLVLGSYMRAACVVCQLKLCWQGHPSTARCLARRCQGTHHPWLYARPAQGALDHHKESILPIPQLLHCQVYRWSCPPAIVGPMQASRVRDQRQRAHRQGDDVPGHSLHRVGAASCLLFELLLAQRAGAATLLLPALVLMCNEDQERERGRNSEDHPPKRRLHFFTGGRAVGQSAGGHARTHLYVSFYVDGKRRR
mmetsp:Transcript_18121/g.52029  ORF Transcript_18121/g.52029 Transcript_18121/m.52029 type:complete len:254 (-) Transcript_18121:23-784(-)